MNTSTDYAVRVELRDGSVTPTEPDELDWFSWNIARKIAAKAYDAREITAGSPVIAIQIINAEYKVVQEHRFND